MKAIQFLRETRAEMKNVTWPTRRRAVLYAVVVIIFSLALGYLIGGLDNVFQFALRSILTK